MIHLVGGPADGATINKDYRPDVSHYVKRGKRIYRYDPETEPSGGQPGRYVHCETLVTKSWEIATEDS